MFDDAKYFSLEDVSANSTWVNGVRVGKGRRRPLKNGDRIVLLHGQSDASPLLEYVFEVIDGQEPEISATDSADEKQKDTMENNDSDDQMMEEQGRKRRSHDEMDGNDVDDNENDRAKDDDANANNDEPKGSQPKRLKWAEGAVGVAAFATGWWFLWNMVPH